MISLIKMSIKLLLRNKGFLFFLLITPILSTVVLNIKMDYSAYNDKSEKSSIIELNDCNDKAVYSGDPSAFVIKVYDNSNSKMSEYVLNELIESGMFLVCRADANGLSENEADIQAEKDAFNDRSGMLMYLKSDFDKAVLNGSWEDGLKLYSVSDDSRQELFLTELSGLFSQIKQAQSVVGDNTDAIINRLKEMQEMLPEKETVNLAGKKSVELSQKQINQHALIGYAFAIITLGFLFCGVCVAHSVIEEKNNKVFTRVMLTKVTTKDYFVSKFVVAFLISLMQTAVLGVCLFFVPGLDVGMSMFSFLLIIFLLGLIFSTLSLMIGVIMGDVMSSNYAAFSIWSISALLAGLYFPLDDTTKALKTLSYLMPQKWFLDASKLLLAGDKSAFTTILCVTFAYLIVIISVGAVGLKIKRDE